MSAKMTSLDRSRMGAVFGARAAAILLGSLMAWSIADGLAAIVQYQLVDESNAFFPSFTSRAAVVIAAQLVGTSVLLGAIRHLSSAAPRVPGRRLPLILLFLLIMLIAAMAAGSAVASVWFPREMAEAVGRSLPTAGLVEWVQQTARLSLISITMKAAGLITAFFYGAYQWWSTAQQQERQERIS